MSERAKPVVLVLASTYPRWRDDPEPGFVHELCRRLTAKFEVIALVPDAPGADPSGILDGVEVVRYRYAPRALETLVNNGGIATNLRRAKWKWLLVPGFVLGQGIAIARLLKKRRVDVIHAHWLIPQGMVARHWRLRNAIPYLVTSHGGDLFGLRGRILTALKRQVASSCSAMTVVSKAMREEALSLGLCPPEIAVLPMGVDMRRRFVVDASVERTTDQLLFVGRLVPKKGLSYLLDAMPAILSERPGVVLTIAGFGPEEKQLKAQAIRLRLGNHVNFAGAVAQPRLPGLYQRASLFVAPFVRDDSGNQEGLPVALMEAIGCGCPVVVGDVAGIHDLLGERAVGICVNPRDTAQLASAVIRALVQAEHSQSHVQAMRDALMERVDWETIAKGYSNILAKCARIPTVVNRAS